MKIKNLLMMAAVLVPLSSIADTEAGASKAAETIYAPITLTLDNPKTWIALLPVLFFLLILGLTTLKLRNDKVKLSDLLAEKDPQTPAAGAAAVVPAIAPVVAAPPVATPLTTPTAPQSVSRFISFLTGLVALTLGICIATFYMYVYFGFNSPDPKIDISSLTNVIWGLGIGVLPYGFNKASAALKPQ